MSSTIYDIRLKYTADDQATKKVAGLAAATERAQRSTFGLGRLLAGIGVGGAFVAGKRLLIDYNNQIDKMKIGMGTVISMQMKKPFSDARREADLLVGRLQEVAKKSPATTKDFVEMANAIAPMVSMMGGGIGKIETLASGAVIAGMATGVRADVAALDVRQMLAGTVTQRDMMANQLLSAKGISKDDFNAMGGAQRAQLTEEMLTDPALKKAADAFGESFAGQISTFQDQMQIAFGAVGLPLMKAISGEVKRWNTWIEKNPAKIAAFTKTLSGGLVKGFEFLRGTAAFFVEHSDLLMGIAKTFLVFKATSMLTGTIGSVAAGINGMVGALSKGTSGIVGVLQGEGGLIGKFSGLIGVLGGPMGVIKILGLLGTAAYGLFQFFRDESDEKRRAGGKKMLATLGEQAVKDQERRKVLRQELASLDYERRMNQKNGKDTPGYEERRERRLAELTNMDRRYNTPEGRQMIADTLKTLSEQYDGLVRSSDGQGAAMIVDVQALRHKLAGKEIDEQAGMTALRALALMAGKDADALLRNGDKELSFWGMNRLAHPEQYLDETAPEEWRDPATDPSSGDINITIQKIEVASEDPDRFVHGAVKAFERAAKNPTQAATTIPGGF